MTGRIRLPWAGLLAATTAVLVGAPAMVQAGITFNGLDCGADDETTSPSVGRPVRCDGDSGGERRTDGPCWDLDASGR